MIINGINIPLFFVSPLLLVVVAELVMGISFGASWPTRRRDDAFGYWINIFVQLAVAGAICYMFNG